MFIKCVLNIKSISCYYPNSSVCVDHFHCNRVSRSWFPFPSAKTVPAFDKNMSPHVLLNFLNELGKRDKIRGLPSILSLFCNKFNKFNNTRAQMLRFYLSYDIKITLKSHFCHKKVIILSLCTQHCYGRHNVFPKIYKPLVVYRFYCMALFYSQTRSHMINQFF